MAIYTIMVIIMIAPKKISNRKRKCGGHGIGRVCRVHVSPVSQ